MADKADLTVAGELNKVAANVSIGRNMAGVHWRSDYTESVSRWRSGWTNTSSYCSKKAHRAPAISQGPPLVPKLSDALAGQPVDAGPETPTRRRGPRGRHAASKDR